MGAGGLLGAWDGLIRDGALRWPPTAVPCHRGGSGPLPGRHCWVVLWGGGVSLGYHKEWDSPIQGPLGVGWELWGEEPQLQPPGPQAGSHGDSTAQCPSQMEGRCPHGQMKGDTPRPQAKRPHSIPIQRRGTSLHHIPTRIGPGCVPRQCPLLGPRVSHPCAMSPSRNHAIFLYSVPMQHPVPCPRVLCQVSMPCPHSASPFPLSPYGVPVWGLCRVPMPCPCAIPQCHTATQRLVPCPPTGASPASPHAVHSTKWWPYRFPTQHPAPLSHAGGRAVSPRGVTFPGEGCATSLCQVPYAMSPYGGHTVSPGSGAHAMPRPHAASPCRLHAQCPHVVAAQCPSPSNPPPSRPAAPLAVPRGPTWLCAPGRLPAGGGGGDGAGRRAGGGRGGGGAGPGAGSGGGGV